LNIGEPGWDAHNKIGDRQLQFRRSSGLDLAQVHRDKLCSRISLLLSQVCHLRTNLAIDVNERRGNKGLLELNIWIIQRPAS
jgi:hypothetical protein